MMTTLAVDARLGEETPNVRVLTVRDPRVPAGPPVAWLLVECQETRKPHPDDGKLLVASLSVAYRVICRSDKHDRSELGDGCFYGRFFRYRNTVSLIKSEHNGGTVFLDLPGLEGHRIGTYLMNQIVNWVRNWPDAEVETITVLPHQADADNKERRNRFYEQFGLTFKWTDDTTREGGSSLPILAGDLTPVETWKKNITDQMLPDSVNGLLAACDEAARRLTDLGAAIAAERQERDAAQAHPIRWAWRRLSAPHARQPGAATPGDLPPSPTLASDGTPFEVWRRAITERSPWDCMRGLFAERETLLKRLDSQTANLARLRAERAEANAHPIGWAGRHLYTKHLYALGLLFWAAFVALTWLLNRN